MIDANKITKDFEESAKLLALKGVDRVELEKLRDLLSHRKETMLALESKRSEMNKIASSVGQLMHAGKKAEADQAKSSVAGLKSALADLEAKFRKTTEDVDFVLLRLPNFPSADVPIGESEKDNVVLRTHGFDRNDYTGKKYLPHWEVGASLGIFDAERAAKISGAGFSVLRGDGARLLRALVQFGLDLNRDTYEEIAAPHFVQTATFTATGHLPKFEADAYRLRDDDLWAIPTGEVPLMSMHRDEILDETDLPRRYMAYTVCFRREAGSAGKDTRGMQRLHEFHKVELVRLCRPEDDQREFDAMLADAERPLKLLNLPYRVVALCTRDLTFSSALIYDLEVYAPGVDKWLEVSSVGKFTDFQPRRGNMRFRRTSTGKTEFVHALNGSALATPRVWAAIIEHYQQPDGSVRVPEPLIPYMGKELIAR